MTATRAQEQIVCAVAWNKGSRSLEDGSQIKLQLRGYIWTETSLEYIQLEHSCAVTEISSDSQCCQNVKQKQNKTKKHGDNQIEKDKHRDSRIFFYLGTMTGSYKEKVEFTDDQGAKTLSQS